MMEIGENETEKYENLLEEYKSVFHQNHFQVFPGLSLTRKEFYLRNFLESLILDPSNEEIFIREY